MTAGPGPPLHLGQLCSVSWGWKAGDHQMRGARSPLRFHCSSWPRDPALGFSSPPGNKWQNGIFVPCLGAGGSPPSPLAVAASVSGPSLVGTAWFWGQAVHRRFSSEGTRHTPCLCPSPHGWATFTLWLGAHQPLTGPPTPHPAVTAQLGHQHPVVGCPASYSWATLVPWLPSPHAAVTPSYLHPMAAFAPHCHHHPPLPSPLAAITPCCHDPPAAITRHFHHLLLPSTPVAVPLLPSLPPLSQAGTPDGTAPAGPNCPSTSPPSSPPHTLPRGSLELVPGAPRSRPGAPCPAQR